MGDFYLDLRPREERQTALAADRLRHFKDVQVTVFEERAFSAVIAREDNPEIWAPFRSNAIPVTVMLAGRIALDAPEWRAAREVEGVGGLACKWIFKQYAEAGVKALELLNGNFTAIVHDARETGRERIFIVMDRAGYAPGYRAEDIDKTPVFSSNPDLLAAAIGAWDNLDVTSMAEFVVRAQVSYPFTYYKKVRGLEYGAITSISLTGHGEVTVTQKRYHDFSFRGSDDPGEHAVLASEFAQAFRSAVRRRSQPEMGKSFLALSGGLDSRTVLSASGGRLIAFSFFDEENSESRVAAQITKALGAEHLKLRRRPDHYAETAAAGVRMEGGMTRFLTNLFLGFRDELLGRGMENFLCGCYCDYMFKGLLGNKKIRKLSRLETQIPFTHQWYAPILKIDSSAMPAVWGRIEEIVPVGLRNKMDNASMHEVQWRRLFPVSYEPDTRGTPQRVMRWSAVTSDKDMLDMFRRIPYQIKLNNRIFHAMMREVCPQDVLSFWDANINAPVDGSELRKFLGKWHKALGYQIEKRRPKTKIASSGSAPNWDYYLTHSEKMNELWMRSNPLAREILTAVAGFDPFEKTMEWWTTGQHPDRIIRLITLKIWLDVRIRVNGDPGAQELN